MVKLPTDDLPNAQAVSKWTADEQSSWARDYGAKLWEIHGDDQVVAELDEDELADERRDSWKVAYKEKESYITDDVDTVSGVLSEDALLSAIETGFKEAFDKAADGNR